MDLRNILSGTHLLDAPAGHEAFAHDPLVVEGGFLEDATRFQEMIRRHDLTAFWLTGNKDQLTESRLKRNSPWDDRTHILRDDWIGMVDRYRSAVRWDYTIRMWDEDGRRKTLTSVTDEILRLLT